jgi:hypothetical protein
MFALCSENPVQTFRIETLTPRKGPNMSTNARLSPAEVHKRLLAGLLESINEYSQVKYASAHRNRSGNFLRERHERATEQTAYYKPSEILGRQLSNYERKAFQAGLRELEAEGFVKVLADSRGRALWVTLTDDGLAIAGECLMALNTPSQ